ncbi:MAG TPA: hypothetical protein VLJ37_06115, partial [bacterium]|nr:hypothetical protein [bacterium]
MTLKKIRLTACLLGAVLGAVCSSSAYSFTVLQACDLCTSPSLPAAIQECCKCVKVCDPEGTPNPAFQSCVVNHEICPALVIERSAVFMAMPYCGNGKVEAGESCDDGKQCEDGQKACTSATDCTGIGSGTCATRDGDSCPSTCRIEYKAATEYQAVYTAPEARPTLQAATEYQAVYTAPEARPTLQAVTGYRAVYKLPSQCGNGSVDTAAGEQCDPKAPNDPNAPYCTSECKIDECLKTSV